MAALLENFLYHLEKHKISLGTNVSIKHEIVHTLLDINGIKESNLTFGSEERQAIMHQALFGSERYVFYGRELPVKIENFQKEGEFKEIREVLENLRENFFLPWFRTIQRLEINRDFYTSRFPEKGSIYSETALYTAFQQSGMNDFSFYKMHVLSTLEDRIKAVDMDTVLKLADAERSKYPDMLSEKEIREIYDMACTIRSNFYKTNRKQIYECSDSRILSKDSEQYIAKQNSRA